jgi:signal peptidase I
MASDESTMEYDGATTRDDQDEDEGGRRHAIFIVAEWIFVVVIAIGAAFLIRTFLFQQYYIDGPSMQTTLKPEDRVLVNKLSYKLHDVNRGDVVVFDRLSGTKHDDLIKRVIALPGESIEIRNCIVFIDGQTLEEPYLDALQLAQTAPSERCGSHVDMSETTIPDEHVFVMGDNRVQSYDSRDFGSIEIAKIRGRAFVALWPFNAWSWL